MTEIKDPAKENIKYQNTQIHSYGVILEYTLEYYFLEYV